MFPTGRTPNVYGTKDYDPPQSIPPMVQYPGMYYKPAPLSGYSVGAGWPRNDASVQQLRIPPAQTSQNLLAESYEQMRYEMRSLGNIEDEQVRHRSSMSAPPPPSFDKPIEKYDPLTSLVDNTNVSLSSLLEAAMDPTTAGNNKRCEDPNMKKTILDKCEDKIAQLYRNKNYGPGKLFPLGQVKGKKGVRGGLPLTFHHPRIEFNMLPVNPLWTCPEVSVESKRQNLSRPILKTAKSTGQRSPALEAAELYANKPLPIQAVDSLSQQQQSILNVQALVSFPPPAVAFDHPPLTVYKAPPPPTLQYSIPPPVIAPRAALASSHSDTVLEMWEELEKERRRKEKKLEKESRKKKKRKKSRSRSRTPRSRSRGRSRGKKRKKRSSRRSRSSSMSLSPRRRGQASRSPIKRRSGSRRLSRSPPSRSPIRFPHSSSIASHYSRGPPLQPNGAGWPATQPSMTYNSHSHFTPQVPYQPNARALFPSYGGNSFTTQPSFQQQPPPQPAMNVRPYGFPSWPRPQQPEIRETPPFVPQNRRNLIDLTTPPRTRTPQPPGDEELEEEVKFIKVETIDKAEKVDKTKKADRAQKVDKAKDSVPLRQIVAQASATFDSTQSDERPPGVSPERLVAKVSAFTKPMRVQLGKRLAIIDKALDSIRRFQRSSVEFRSIVKGLEKSGNEFDSVYTLHDGLLCRVVMDRRSSSKCLKLAMPPVHVTHTLEEIHAMYHDYSAKFLLETMLDLFQDSYNFNFTYQKITAAIKSCSRCKVESVDNKALEQKVMPKQQAENSSSFVERRSRSNKDKFQWTRPKSEGESVEEPRKNDASSRHRSRPSEPSDNTIEKSKNKYSKSSNKKPPEEIETDKFEKDSKRATKESRAQEQSKSKTKASVIKESLEQRLDGSASVLSDQPKQESTTDAGMTNSAGYIADRTASQQDRLKVDSSQEKQASKMKDVTIKSPSPPEDFKIRVRRVQLTMTDLKAVIDELEGPTKKASDSSYLLKAGMLCKRSTLPDGKADVKIVVTPKSLSAIAKIVHTMAEVHAPLQKTISVFNKHFTSIDNSDSVIAQVMNSCLLCKNN